MIETVASKPSVCIIRGGNAAHAMATLLPHRSYAHTTMYCPFQDEADRMNADLAEQGRSCTETLCSTITPAASPRASPFSCPRTSRMPSPRATSLSPRSPP